MVREEPLAKKNSLNELLNFKTNFGDKIYNIAVGLIGPFSYTAFI